MTIAAGFYCRDGVVLAADTEITISGGAGKTYSSKMLTISPPLGCYATYAGSPDVAKELMQELRQSVRALSEQVLPSKLSKEPTRLIGMRIMPRLLKTTSLRRW